MMKIYITSEAAISPWNNDFSSTNNDAKESSYSCIEPNYSEYLDPRASRRMSRIMKMGLTSALMCLKKPDTGNPDAIMTATALGCLEDTAAFISKLSHKDGQLLNPTPFIQSTHNTVGGAIALHLKCNSYNNTFTHRGFSFESALTEALLLLKERHATNILLGAMDELIEPVINILHQLSKLKKSDKNMISPGEGVTFFRLSDSATPDALQLAHFETLFNPEAEMLASAYSKIVIEGKPDVILAGINGSASNDRHYQWLLSLSDKTPVIAYKNYCGEYPTAPAFAHWLACFMLRNGLPDGNQPQRILIYNHFEGRSHSFSLIKK
jgi:hypothetical protein